MIGWYRKFVAAQPTRFLNVLYVLFFLVASFIFDRLGWDSYVGYLVLFTVIVRMMIFWITKK